MDNLLFTFLKEALQRLFLKQPKFFKIITSLGIGITIFLGIPSFLATNQELLCNDYGFCFDMPLWLTEFWAKATPIATLLASFISGLTANTKDKKKIVGALD